jgi:hypothetical protein
MKRSNTFKQMYNAISSRGAWGTDYPGGFHLPSFYFDLLRLLEPKSNDGGWAKGVLEFWNRYLLVYIHPF